MSLELSGIRYPLAEFAVEADIHLAARVTALFGPSGAGKTTLLELIAGLRRPAAGTVRIEGELVADAATGFHRPPEARAIGYVAQDGALFPHLSVRANLLYGRYPGRTRPPGLSFEHVAAVLEIAPQVDRSVHALSGGEKRRVALARALLAAPRLLLLDEPLAELDLPLRERLLPYLLRIRDEFAFPMIYVSHSPDEIVALAGDVLVLERGRIVRRGPTAEIFAPSAETRYELRPAPGPR